MVRVTTESASVIALECNLSQPKHCTHDLICVFNNYSNALSIALEYNSSQWKHCLHYLVCVFNNYSVWIALDMNLPKDTTYEFPQPFDASDLEMWPRSSEVAWMGQA